jgi:trans-aconitate 2-methyltransferase
MTEWDAGAYARQSSLQEAMAEEQIALLRLAGEERVLDVGCGDGRLTAEIAAKVPRGSVVGVDPSQHMIEFARAHAGASASNLSFEVADVRELPFRDEFDAVVSFNALHWVREQDRALAAIATALRPGGEAHLRLVSAGPRKSLEDVIEETRAAPRWARAFEGFRTPYRHLAPERYRTLAEAAGLRVLACDAHSKAWDFGSRQVFAAFARVMFVEWTARLPQAEWDGFIADVLDRYRDVACDRPGEENVFKFEQMDVALARPA